MAPPGSTAFLDALNAVGRAGGGHNGYHGAGPMVRVPQRRRRLDPDTARYRRLSRSQRLVNAARARQRGPGERANAQLKSWKILRKIRCCPYQAEKIEGMCWDREKGRGVYGPARCGTSCAATASPARADARSRGARWNG